MTTSTADRARITIACAHEVLTETETVALDDTVATARAIGRLQATVEELLALVETKHPA